MKKITIGIIILSAVLTGFYFYSRNITPPPAINKSELLPLPKTKEACLEQNGVWGKIGLSLDEKCNLRTTDAGKYCTDSSQCESSCVGSSAYSRSGKCTSWRITVGCYYFVRDGKVDGLLCAD